MTTHPNSAFPQRHTTRRTPLLAVALTTLALLSAPMRALADLPPPKKQAAAPAAPSGVATETLAKSTTAWDQTRYKAYPAGVPEPTLVRITIAPNTRLDWHTHAMPVVAYVAAGNLSVERADNGARRAFAAGQTITELVDVPHRGVTGDTGAELLVFYAREAQQPLSVASPAAAKLAKDDKAKPAQLVVD
ncbi:cupin domain-containing protein [Pandoraea anhela]|uniref:Cupin n=1 Tax=Pandoraea anhela TaxID=2508295 RepID=A0A5E4VCT2_9BURK|nr:cupin domain-containing protein [Pandoraea anhela]VVE10098.1 hypothetical protein PAN31108_02579 [Pandoraea anhela]